MKFSIMGKSGETTRLVGRLFHDAGESIYLVGGAVRDLLAGGPPQDLDFTTSAPAPKMENIVRRAAKAVYDKSQAKGYGTRGVLLKDGTEVEITPFRRAGNPAGGEPATLEEDLRSRDFTINAVALNAWPADFGEPADPFGGIGDFNARVLRTPAPPLETFNDDPLRVLRAARFTAKYSMAPAAGLADAITAAVREHGWQARVAPERAREEIVKMLMLEPPSPAFRLLLEWGLLDCWLPEVAALDRLKPEAGADHKDHFEHTMVVLDKAAAAGPADPAFRFAALLHDIGKPAARRLENGKYSFPDHDKTGAGLAREVCGRLRWSNKDTDLVADLVLKHNRLSSYSPEWTDSAVRRALHDLGGVYREVIALSRSDISSASPEKVEQRLARVEHFLARVEALEKEAVLNPKPPLDGNEVMRLLSLKPGPGVGRVLDCLKEKIISGELDPRDAETAREIVLSRTWE